MLNKVSTKLIVQKGANLDSVYLRVICKRQKFRHLLYKVQKGKFNEAKQKVVNCPDSFLLNMLSDERKNMVTAYVFDCELKKKIVQIQDLKNLFLTVEKSKSVGIFSFFQSQIEISVVSKEHKRHQLAAVSKFKKYVESVRAQYPKMDNDYPILDADNMFFHGYFLYQQNVLENSPNTIIKNFTFLKVWMKEAKKQGLIKTDPLLDFKLRKKKTKRHALSWNEVLKLESALNSEAPHVVKNVIRWFLFCCYTGLRYGDLSVLRWSDITDDLIVINQNKTLESVKIPLIQRAQQLAGPRGDGFVFKVLTNQKCNDYLKVAAAWAGIEKNLTFHLSRHTFATISLNLGMRLEVVSELLGHKDIRTTRIYTELLDATLRENMKLLDNKINSK